VPWGANQYKAAQVSSKDSTRRRLTSLDSKPQHFVSTVIITGCLGASRTLHIQCMLLLLLIGNRRSVQAWCWWRKLCLRRGQPCWCCSRRRYVNFHRCSSPGPGLICTASLLRSCLVQPCGST
jgi:hypothetical protein